MAPGNGISVIHPDTTSGRYFVLNNSGTLEFNIDVTDGIIHDIRIFGDYFNMCDTEEIEKALRNIPHSEGKIREALAPYNISDYFNNLSIKELLEGMF